MVSPCVAKLFGGLQSLSNGYSQVVPVEGMLMMGALANNEQSRTYWLGKAMDVAIATSNEWVCSEMVFLSKTGLD